MSDEVRRLIYELVVEAKGVKEAEQKVSAGSQAMEQMIGVAKKVGATLAAAFAVKEIAKTLGDIQKMQSQLKVLGLSSSEASKGIKDIENVAVATGSTIAEVAAVYGAAIEATQKLGGTQADAAELANAFTRAAKAEGKGAAEAAAQLDTLQFAMDRGTVKAKELANIMKQSETFQQAAEKAMGKTTAEILKMAEAGQLGAQDLGAMLDVMKEMGANAEVPTTLEGITNSLIGMGQAFVNAIAESSGLNESLSHGVSGWQKFLDILRLIGAEIGAVISLAFNLVETMVQGAIAINVAFVQAITGNFKGAADTFDLFAQQVKENIDDVGRSLANVGDASRAVAGEVTTTPGRALGDPDALARQQREAAFEKGADDFIKSMMKESEEAKKIRAREAKEREKEETEAARARFKKENEAFEQAQKERLELQQMFDATREQAGRDALEGLEKQQESGLKKLGEQLDAIEERAVEGAAVIGNALGNVFSGATHNAREFFRDILQGFAQMAASAAIQKFMGLLQNNSGFSSFMGMFMAEHGHAFNRGTVVPFAQGGVVGGPTAFPMSGGRMGLMGEAGAEAVMPLRRGSDGKLGVVGARPHVEIHNNLGVAANASVNQSGDRMQIILEAAQLGASMAENRVNRSLRTGYGPTAQSMQRTYGVRRRF